MKNRPMSKQEIIQIIQRHTPTDELFETEIEGIKLFHITSAVPCTPVVYEPTIVAIVSGSKEAILNGQHHIYNANQYLCCPTFLPVEAGAPNITPEEPLLGVYISLSTQRMTDLTLAMKQLPYDARSQQQTTNTGLSLAKWDESFTQALLRVLHLLDTPMDRHILAEGRLRELYYAVLKGDSGTTVLQAFSVDNTMVKVISYMATHVQQEITIEELCRFAGMSRAVFHRQFKQVTTHSPLQFLKALRLNQAARNITEGMNVMQAAESVGYNSSSQFSREFKRMYGLSPKKWSSSLSIHAHTTDSL